MAKGTLGSKAQLQKAYQRGSGQRKKGGLCFENARWVQERNTSKVNAYLGKDVRSTHDDLRSSGLGRIDRRHAQAARTGTKDGHESRTVSLSHHLYITPSSHSRVDIDKRISNTS